MSTTILSRLFDTLSVQFLGHICGIDVPSNHILDDHDFNASLCQESSFFRKTVFFCGKKTYNTFLLHLLRLQIAPKRRKRLFTGVQTLIPIWFHPWFHPCPITNSVPHLFEPESQLRRFCKCSQKALQRIPWVFSCANFAVENPVTWRFPQQPKCHKCRLHLSGASCGSMVASAGQ